MQDLATLFCLLPALCVLVQQSGSMGVMMLGPPCTRRLCASLALLVATASVLVSGDLLVLAFAVCGARLGREAAATAYLLIGAVGGAGALLGIMAIVWGQDA